MAADAASSLEPFDLLGDDSDSGTMGEVPAASADIPQERISPLGALFGVLFRPAATFRRMREAPVGHWWVVAVLGVLAVVFVSVTSAPIIGEVQQAGFVAAGSSGGPGGGPPDGDTTITPADGAQAAINFQLITTITTLVTGILGLFIVYLLHAALLFALGLLMGGHAGFKQVFRMAVWTTLPAVFRSLISAAATLATGNLPTAGLSYILTGAEAQSLPVVAAMLQTFDIYRVWTLILIGVGAAATYRLSAGKSLLIVILYWMVIVVLALIGALIAQAAASALGF